MSSSLAAQPGNAPLVQADGSQDESFARDGVFLPPDRATRNRLESAEKMLAEKRYGESVRYLGSLLDSSEDFFYKPTAGRSLYRSLKAEASRLIGELPAEGRESYELQFGATARRALEEAAQKGDSAVLAEVARRYFYTAAGAETTLLLGRQHLDFGRPMAAAVLLSRLQQNRIGAEPLEPTLSILLATSWLRAGHSDKAQEVLLELKKTHGQKDVMIAGRREKLFSTDSEALQWLVKNFGQAAPPASSAPTQWVLQGGDATRNATSVGGMPLLNLRWRQQTAADTKLHEMASQLRQGYLEQGIAAIPSMQPLAIGDLVLMRTTNRLQAINFQTGKRIWRYPADEQSGDEPVPSSQAQMQAQMLGQPATPLARLDKRMWDDATYGTLSSDDESVFCLEDMEPLPPSQGGVNLQRNNRFNPQGMLLRSTNRLAALELATEGKLRWRVGGPTGEDEPRLAGAYFLGPPLPIGGRLFGLAETRGQEIRLVVLSAATGQLEWSQQLAFVQETLLDDSSRRTAGLTPSFADGVLICPTGSGAVVAVDVANRSLLWGYQYPQPDAGEERMRRGGIFQINANVGSTEPRAADRWMDGIAIIAQGRVLVTPPESDDLYCLNVADGQLQWKQKRGANLYVGAVQDGRILLVGHHQLNAIQLTDGKPAWKQPLLLADGAVPMGRGFYTGGDYYLPLSTAEIVRVSTAKGEIVDRVKSRRGNIPGNLVAHRGHILSQNSDYLDVYSQIDALRADVAAALQKNAEDPRALARQGELELHDGRMDQALALLRHSYQLQQNLGTHDMLVESLLGALKQDFAAHRQAAAELESLIDQKQHRLAYLRLMCEGLQAAGEYTLAFDKCLELVELAPELTVLDSIDKGITVRRDRWVKARIAQLYAAGDETARQRIDEVARQRLTKAAEAQSAEPLRNFLHCFGSLPLAEEAREMLVVRLLPGDATLECEMLLRGLEQSANADRSRAATARLARLLKDGKHPQAAVPLYRRLNGELGDVVCLDGKSGTQLYEELPADSAIRASVQEEIAWPLGVVKTKAPSDGKRPSLPRQQATLELDYRGEPGPFYYDTSVSLEWQTQMLIFKDQLGREKNRISVINPQQLRPNAFPYPQIGSGSLDYVSTQGTMVALYLGFQVIAFDTQYQRELTNGMIWNQELVDPVRNIAAGQGYRKKEVKVPWGTTVTTPIDTMGRPLGQMGPLGTSSLCVQRNRELICLDPLTGKTLWSRKNVTPGCALYGDDEVIIAAPTDSAEALILSAVDGQLLGRRLVPSIEQRMAAVGRNLLWWRTDGDQPALVFTDLTSGEEKWSLSVDAGTKAALIGNEEVCVFTGRIGEFKVLRISDGQALVDQKLQPEQGLVSIAVTRSSNQYLLITDARAEPNDSETRLSPYPSGSNRNRLVSGRMYALERATGKPMWPAPVQLKQQGIVAGQPREAPIFVFARNQGIRSANGPQQNRTALWCIDKRNGRIAYDDKLTTPGNTNNLEIEADPKADTVTLSFTTQAVVLQLTDETLPPEEQPAEKQPAPNTFKELGKAVGRAMDNLFGTPTDDTNELFEDDD